MAVERECQGRLCQRQFRIFTFSFKIFRNLVRPSPAGRRVLSIGLGFFPCVTVTSAAGFFHPMDTRGYFPSFFVVVRFIIVFSYVLVLVFALDLFVVM